MYVVRYMVYFEVVYSFVFWGFISPEIDHYARGQNNGCKHVFNFEVSFLDSYSPSFCILSDAC